MKAEKYRETLIEVTFVAYGKQMVEFFWDCTIQQSLNKIWKDICPTAIILFAWEYSVVAPKQLQIDKKKLTDEELTKYYKK